MLSAIRNTALAATVGLSLVAVPKADAAYVAYLYQDGSNVVGTGSGSIDTTGLTFRFNFTAPIEVEAAAGYLGLGQTGLTAAVYGGQSGPPSFGSGGSISPSSSSGSIIAIQGGAGQTGENDVAVPDGYVSGTSLGTSTDTWDGATLAAFGVTDGTYTWTWGTGAHTDSYTLHIGEAPPAGAPEPASLTVLALGLAGLGMVRRIRRT